MCGRGLWGDGSFRSRGWLFELRLLRRLLLGHRHGGLAPLRLLLIFIRSVVPEQVAQLQRHVLFHRAGVGLLLGDPQVREPFQNFTRLDFQLPRQLINANTLHK